MKKIITILIIAILILLSSKVKASVIDSGDRLYNNSLFGNCGSILFNGDSNRPFVNNGGGLMCEYHYSQQGGTFFNYIQFNIDLDQDKDYLVIPITINFEATGTIDQRILLHNFQFLGWNGVYRPVYYELVNSNAIETNVDDAMSNISMLFNVYIDVKNFNHLGRLYFTFANAQLHSYNAYIFISTDTYYIKGSTAQIIDNQNQNTDKIINETTSYEGINQSEEINGSEELTSYEQEEQNLLDSLNMTEVDNLDITINPNASSFIWTIVDALRNMSSKIIVFMTSVLGLGVIKMLLNR